MASSADFVQYACDQLRGAGVITNKKMFGEYGLYCDGKFFGMVCDNQLYIKITQAGEALLPDCPRRPPYEGGNDAFAIEDIENTELLARVVQESWKQLPFPKPRKKKEKSAD